MRTADNSLAKQLQDLMTSVATINNQFILLEKRINDVATFSEKLVSIERRLDNIASHVKDVASAEFRRRTNLLTRGLEQEKAASKSRFDLIMTIQKNVNELMSADDALRVEMSGVVAKFQSRTDFVVERVEQLEKKQSEMKEAADKSKALEVNVKQTRDRAQVTIIVRQTKYVVIAGETARLECYAEPGGERVTLFWSRQAGLPPGTQQVNGVLTIPNTQPSAAGRYICTGTDTDTGKITTAEAVLEVNVKQTTVAPTVTMEPERITIPMGTTGTLRCAATGTPQPTLTWSKSREQLSSNHQVTGNILRITQATMADRGIYVCRAENSAGVAQDWTNVEVERRIRPQIDVYPNTTARVTVGASMMFQCRVLDGAPTPRTSWSRSDGLTMSERVKVMENGVLRITQVTSEDQGGYVCTAENDMGVVTIMATLHVEGPPTVSIQPSRTVYGIIGQRVTLECTAVGDPTPSVRWIEPDRSSRGNVSLEGLDIQGITSPGSATVEIRNLQKSDEGTYLCVAVNTGGRTEDRVQLIVGESSVGVSISGPSTLSVNEGQLVELVCTANHILNPVIRWSRREGTLPPGHSVQNGVLTLPRFRSEYSGEYICTTSVQTNTYEASVFIIVTVAPRLTISPQRITTRTGEAVQLRCTASGSGPFNIEWSRVDAQMNPTAVKRDGILEIRQVSAADAGRYRCVAQSSAGSSEGFAIVTVEVPPAVKVSQRDVYMESNRVASLRCEATGFPVPSVRWEKKGDQLPEQHRVQNGTLTIYNVRDEDAGRYICTASSSAGTSRDYSVLHVSSGCTPKSSSVGTASASPAPRCAIRTLTAYSKRTSSAVLVKCVQREHRRVRMDNVAL